MEDRDAACSVVDNCVIDAVIRMPFFRRGQSVLPILIKN